jgi:hypothetical protein
MVLAETLYNFRAEGKYDISTRKYRSDYYVAFDREGYDTKTITAHKASGCDAITLTNNKYINLLHETFRFRLSYANFCPSA